MLIAEFESAAAGYLLYHFGYWLDDAQPTLHVADLFVRETARGKGAGSALMAEAARILSAHGGKMLLWTVWEKNKCAMDFYRSLGAEFFAEEHLMRWTVERWLNKEES